MDFKVFGLWIIYKRYMGNNTISNFKSKLVEVIKLQYMKQWDMSDRYKTNEDGSIEDKWGEKYAEEDWNKTSGYNAALDVVIDIIENWNKTYGK